MTKPTRLLTLLAVLAAALLAAGCGSDDEGGAASSQETPAATATATATATEPSAPSGDNTNLSTKPVIAKPSGDPPTDLVTEDIVTGKGKAAKAGDMISVQYVGASWSTGEEFDSSWDRGGEPFTFQLGGGQVIEGWDKGLAGMKVGGRRQLTIPPDQAYGPAGSPPAIGPDETLIFVVDLQQIG